MSRKFRKNLIKATKKIRNSLLIIMIPKHYQITWPRYLLLFIIMLGNYVLCKMREGGGSEKQTMLGFLERTSDDR